MIQCSICKLYFDKLRYTNLCKSCYNKQYKTKRKKYIKEYSDKYQQNNQQYFIKYRIDHRHDTTKRCKKYREDIRLKFIELYGSHCNNCGINNPMVLTMDHINNDGAKRRKRDNGHNGKDYLDAINTFQPNVYQILCFNCNWIKYITNLGKT